jgi:hypothetical protein
MVKFRLIAVGLSVFGKCFFYKKYYENRLVFYCRYMYLILVFPLRDGPMPRTDSIS